MSPADSSQQQRDDFSRQPPIQCDACESALHANGGAFSFLIMEQLRLPLIGCTQHLEQFRFVCGLTTDTTAEILDHYPAGGITCPSCRLAPHTTDHVVVPVQDGAVAILACQEHQAKIIDRFHTGLDTQQQLTTSLDLE